MTVYRSLPNVLPDGESPVERRHVVVTGDKNENLSLTEVHPGMDEGAFTHELLKAVLSRLQQQTGDHQVHLGQLRVQYELQRNKDLEMAQRHHQVVAEHLREQYEVQRNSDTTKPLLTVFEAVHCSSRPGQPQRPLPSRWEEIHGQC
jgi:hypothetical protein